MVGDILSVTKDPIVLRAQRLGESVHLQVIPGGEHGTGDLHYLETMPPKALRAYLELLSS